MALIQNTPPVADDGTVLAAAWNTRRLYSAAGQRIAAAFLIDYDLVVFVDIDRGIEGKFPVDAELASLITDERDLRAEVMYRYDRGEFRESLFDVPASVVGRLHHLATNAGA